MTQPCLEVHFLLEFSTSFGTRCILQKASCVLLGWESFASRQGGRVCFWSVLRAEQDRLHSVRWGARHARPQRKIKSKSLCWFEPTERKRTTWNNHITSIRHATDARKPGHSHHEEDIKEKCMLMLSCVPCLAQGMQVLYKLPSLPSAAKMVEIAEKWHPYRSVGVRDFMCTLIWHFFACMHLLHRGLILKLPA